MKSIIDFFKKLYSEIWLGVTPGYRVLFVMMVVMSLGALCAILYWSVRPEYVILSSGLAAKDAAELADELEGANVSVRLGQDGTSVMVPRSQRHRARIVAAREGLAGGGFSGFESFKNPQIGMTPFAERINYLNALQNELAATVSSLEGIKNSRVHIAIPEDQVFRDDRRRPSASVVVEMRGGRQLSRGEAQAITSLVASAVEKMSAEDVTISDSRGNVVGGADESLTEAAADDHFTYRRRIEDHLAGKAESMLARVLGSGRSEVRVSADLDFRDERKVEKIYDESNQVMVSENISTMSSSGPGRRVGGMVGETPRDGDEGGRNEEQQVREEDIDTQYLVGESMIESVNRNAVIERLTVSAIVDIRDKESIGVDDVAGLIEDAVGIKEERGDRVNVTTSRFMAEETAPPHILQSPLVGQVAKYFAVGVFGLVLLYISKRMMKKLDSSGRALQKDILIPEVMMPGSEDEGGMDAGGEELMRQQVAKLVEEDPEMAGRLLESWIQEE